MYLKLINKKNLRVHALESDSGVGVGPQKSSWSQRRSRSFSECKESESESELDFFNPTPQPCFLYNKRTVLQYARLQNIPII